MSLTRPELLRVPLDAWILVRGQCIVMTKRMQEPARQWRRRAGASHRHGTEPQDLLLLCNVVVRTSSEPPANALYCLSLDVTSLDNVGCVCMAKMIPCLLRLWHAWYSLFKPVAARLTWSRMTAPKTIPGYTAVWGEALAESGLDEC